MPFRADTLTLAKSTLREAQAGALHAIAAHRSASEEPAQIVLPTGVGKTLVAVLAPYVLDAERVLVVTPARIVRDQVAYEYSQLAQAIDSPVASADNTAPRSAPGRSSLHKGNLGVVPRSRCGRGHADGPQRWQRGG